MNFICQKSALDNLKQLAEHNQHGVIICGSSGSGKTYLARQYAALLKIKDFYIINPAVSDLRSMIDACITQEAPVVMCIENLDKGVIQAAYPLLKFIEDAPRHIYIVVTCSNLQAIPDTIPSRCALVNTNTPTVQDLAVYAEHKDADAYNRIRNTKVWNCVHGFNDADTVLQFTADQLQHFTNLPTIVNPVDSVSNVSWRLSHFTDNSETPIVLIIRYLLYMYTGNKKRACLACLNDLAENRLSKNAIVSKLVFELLYT